MILSLHGMSQILLQFNNVIHIVKLRSDWRAFGVNFLFLLGTHAAKWVQHPFKNETQTSNFRLMARQSERGFTHYSFVHILLTIVNQR